MNGRVGVTTVSLHLLVCVVCLGGGGIARNLAYEVPAICQDHSIGLGQVRGLK